MTRLRSELERLYFLPDQCGSETASLCLTDDQGRVRTVVVDFERSCDWPHVEALYRALQADLDLPAPAVAVRANVGYTLWLSLAEPVALADAQAFLAALRGRYLADLPVDALTLHPCGDAAQNLTVPLLPACAVASGTWSAFIDPTLGALFVDEPWLAMAPNSDKQADILAALKSVDVADFARARQRLRETQAVQRPLAETDAAAAGAGLPAKSQRGKRRGERAKLALGGGYADPASFLLALMNDPSASARQRIAAAKALLPYYASRKD